MIAIPKKHDFHVIINDKGVRIARWQNEKGNQCRSGVVPRFSDKEVIALSLTAESISIDSENYLFAK